MRPKLRGNQSFGSSWCAVFLIAILLTNAHAEWNDTSTGINLDELPRFPLTRIRSGWLKEGSTVTFEGITATAEAPNARRKVRLQGKAKSRKSWEVHLFGLDEVWRGDLDGNGIQDYVLFASGPYLNGRTTPLFSLSILLMDKDGLPVPFFTPLYHGSKEGGTKHLVDLNRDGKAELLINSYDELTSDPRAGPSCSGHWTTQAYRFEKFGAREVRGTIGRMKFPLIHGWTYRGKQCPEEETPQVSAQPAMLFENGTSIKGEAKTTIVRTSWQGRSLVIEPAAGCREIVPNVVLYDHARVREIWFPHPLESYAKDVLEKLSRERARLKLRGIERQEGGHCSVNLLWAVS